MALALLALGIGFVTGLRSMTGPAAIAWAARLGWLRLAPTGLAFLAHPVVAVVLTLAAVGELVGDKLPRTPARTALPPFVFRVVLGGLGGAAIGLGTGGTALVPAILGAVGAVAGTLGGYAFRMRVPRKLRLADFPFALAEDLMAVGLAWAIVAQV